MKFGNVILVWFLLIVTGIAVLAGGWALSFAFASEVFVPWLGVIPPDYHNLASFVSAFIFDGIGAAIVLGVLVSLGFTAAATYRLVRGKRK